MPDQVHHRKPRSVALVGPYGSGKSTLFDSLLTAAGASIRRVDPRVRAMTTEARLGHCSYLGESWSLLDCPGSLEFSFEAAACIAVADLAVVVCEPSPSRALTLAPLLKMLDEQSIPHIVFVNKIETMDGRVRDTMAALQAHSRSPLVLRQIPIRDGEKVTGYVDVVSDRAYRYRRGQPSELISMPSAVQARKQEARDALLEVLADHDDALLEKILSDAAPDSGEIFAQLHRDQVEAKVTEVLFGAAESDSGVRRLWKTLRHDTPEPNETAARRRIAEAGDPLVQVFKTVHAGHQGRLSYARIWRGTVRDGATLNGTRVAGVFRMPNGEPAKVAEAGAGEIVALGRMEGVETGCTLGGDPLPFPTPPAPLYSLAIHTQDRKDDVKLSAALQRAISEDPSLRVDHDTETGETVLHGQGEIHLNAAVERLAKTQNLKIATSRPGVAFKETIRHAVHQHARLKRQTGGHGQFADVKLDIAPRSRGEGFLFINKIVGGAVPKQYVPAVAEAAAEAAQKGPLGYPVVDIAVTLVDGGFHSVDSSEMAFRSATRAGMAEALAKASPVLLEPIEHVTISIPNDFTAKAQRLLTGRRGQILGYTERPGWPGWDEVEALVPGVELHGLIIELRSQTAGLGTYAHRFDHLAEAPERLERHAG